jgi:hypothetical protein
MAKEVRNSPYPQETIQRLREMTDFESAEFALGEPRKKLGDALFVSELSELLLCSVIKKLNRIEGLVTRLDKILVLQKKLPPGTD